MEIIYAEIRKRVVELYTSPDIVQCCFIVQNSLSPLNLELCQSYVVSDGQTDKKYPSFSYSKDFINSEEKCRKVLTKCRSVLYTLHLDLPRDKEKSLRSDSNDQKLSSDWKIPLVAKIRINSDFYADILYNLIHYACKGNDNNLKILKWFLKFNVLEKSVFDGLPCSITNYFLECMHPGLKDSEFVLACLEKLNLIYWLFSRDSSKPGRFSNLLYQCHRIGIAEYIKRSDQLVDFFISLSSPQPARDILKLKNAPSFCDELYYFYVEAISSVRHTFPEREITTDMSVQRQTLLLQLFWIYLKISENPTEASEFLRLIWNSVPDSFLVPEEIEAAFRGGIDSAETTDIYNFYSESIQIINTDLHPVVAPRSLKHYSRTVIRRILSQNGHWLPDGIKETGLPSILQSYLNLENDFLAITY